MRGEARLTSSTSTTFAMIGPGRKCQSPELGWYTLVPVMSAGNRSGVHCTRPNLPPIATARPAAEACTAPQAPSASPVWFLGARFIVAVRVPCPNSPAPKPISIVPNANRIGESAGAGQILQEEVPAAQQRRERQSHHTGLPSDDAVDRAVERRGDRDRLARCRHLVPPTSRARKRTRGGRLTVAR